MAAKKKRHLGIPAAALPSRNPFWGTKKGAARVKTLEKRLDKLGSILKKRAGKTPKGKTPYKVLARRYTKLASKVASHSKPSSAFMRMMG